MFSKLKSAVSIIFNTVGNSGSGEDLLFLDTDVVDYSQTDFNQSEVVVLVVNEVVFALVATG